MSFIRVILSGSLPGGETWSVSPAYNETTNVSGWDQAAGQVAADAIADLEVPIELLALMSGSSGRQRVRVERRTDANVLLGAAEALWSGGAPGNGSATKTFQSAVVISLRSNVPGSRGRGRIYWPAIGAVIGIGNLRLSNPTPAAVATAAASYLDAIETELKNALEPVPSLIDYHLAVYSPTTQTKVDVSRIEVGDVLDTQRRRRDRVPEVYSSVPYP